MAEGCKSRVEALQMQCDSACAPLPSYTPRVRFGPNLSCERKLLSWTRRAPSKAAPRAPTTAQPMKHHESKYESYATCSLTAFTTPGGWVFGQWRHRSRHGPATMSQATGNVPGSLFCLKPSFFEGLTAGGASAASLKDDG